MATTIKLKNGSGAPLAGDLVQGEPALDLTNKRLYTENASGTIIEVGTNPTSLTTGTFTSTGIDDNATSTAITIDSSENVGIGTASPTQPLDISASMASAGSGPVVQVTETSGGARNGIHYTSTATTNSAVDLFKIEDAVGTRFIVKGGGNVGIGETAPSRALDIKSANPLNINTTSNNHIHFQVNDVTTGQYASSPSLPHQLCDSTGSSPRLVVDSSGNVLVGGTSQSGTANKVMVKSADKFGLSIIDTTAQATGVGGALNLGGNYRTSGDAQAFTRIAALKDNSTDSNFAYSMGFYTTPNGGTFTERMRIDSSGNVGIGTTSPSGVAGTILELSKSGSTRLNISAGDSSYSAVDFSDTSADGSGRIEYYHIIDAMRFWTNGSETMRIDSSGNVGIGTASPAYKLSVHADAVGTTYPLKIENSNTTSGNGVALLFTHRAHGGDNQGSIEYVGAGANNTNAMLFKTEASGVNGMAERMRIDSSGNLLVGTTSTYSTSPKAAIGIQSTGTGLEMHNSGGTAWTAIRFHTASTLAGYISVGTTTTTYNTSSDQRLKENIVDAPAGNIDDIRVRSFDWKADGSHQTYGMVAQELVEVAPEAVSQGETEEDMWGVDYSKLVPMMIKEIQDLKAEVAALKGA